MAPGACRPSRRRGRLDLVSAIFVRPRRNSNLQLHTCGPNSLPPGTPSRISDDLSAYLKERLPAAAVPRVVVLDNASLHVSKVTKAARPGLARLWIYLYYLPAAPTGTGPRPVSAPTVARGRASMCRTETRRIL
jgi:hypothetical protein